MARQPSERGHLPLQRSGWRRVGKDSSEPRPAPPGPCLATKSAEEPSPGNASRSGRANSSEWSSAVPFVFVQQAAQFVDFLARGATPGESVHHQLTRGAFKNALQHISGKLTFGL